ncbi:MAG: DUF3696 domain-containing protein [Bacteroidetes bacterium]|jgi:predicted ATPase|nr:DUF3696 domain-containing protein [Bacteroidota bacterium]
MINKIFFSNYKSFKSKQEIDLKPITILIGKNSSGKSAISKLVPLLSDSLSGNFSPVMKWENYGIKLGLSNKDLVYNRAITSILDFSVFSEEEELQISIGVDRKDKANIYKWVYNGKSVDVAKTNFKGFKAHGINFKKLNVNFDYIGPFREIPRPSYSTTFENYNKIGITGSNAYPILIQSFNSLDGLLNSVSNWYEKNFEGWRIDVIEITAPEPSYQVVFSNKSISQINIVNVGQGMNQALPLIVRTYMPDEQEVRIVMEEPETHLHPAAHGNLAQRFVDSYIENSNRKYLIETHSQNFVLRMRRMVAEKKLKKEDLAIYYVDFVEDTSESTLKLIPVYDDGSVEWWPDGIFTETLTETRAIKDAQLKDKPNVD